MFYKNKLDQPLPRLLRRSPKEIDSYLDVILIHFVEYNSISRQPFMRLPVFCLGNF